MPSIELKPVTYHSEDVPATDAALTQEGERIVEAERELGVFRTGIKHWRVVLTACVSLTSAAVFGYDTVVNGASIAMPAFLLYFGNIGPTGPYLPSLWTSLWTAMSSLTQAIGAICCGAIVDRLGRKWPATASAVLTLAGTAVQFRATSRGALMGGKMVSGFGIGAILAIATTYISEIAPLRLRAPLQTVLVMSIVFLQGVALGVVRAFVPNINEVAFRHVFAIQWAVGGIATIWWALTPESPIYLAKRGKMDAARAAMARIYGKTNSPNARLEFMLHVMAEEMQAGDSGSYLACFKGHNLKRTLTVAFLYATSNIGGAAFLAQNIYFLITAGLPAIHSFDVGIGGFALAIVIVAFSGLYLQKLSRRAVVLAGLVFNLIAMIIIGGLYWAPGQGPLWAIAVLMNVLISIQTATLQGAGWPIAAEIPSLQLRAKTLSIGIFAQTGSTWIFLFTTPYMYNVDSGNLGARTGLVYAGFTVLMLAAAWVLIPNTMGMTTEEIDNAYEAKLQPRKFQQFKRHTTHATTTADAAA